MKLSLVILKDNKEDKELPVRLAQFLIGRDPQCHLRPASSLVSKRHCAVLQRDGKFFLRDFESTNGTILNQQPLKGEAELKQGDEFYVGPLGFRVKLTAGAGTTPAPVPAKPKVAPVPVSAETKTPLPSQLGPGDSDENMFGDLLMTIESPSINDTAPEIASSITDTTLMSVPAIREVALETKREEALNTEETSAEKKPVQPKIDAKQKFAADQGKTADAAKSILDKYMKRPRPVGK